MKSNFVTLAPLVLILALLLGGCATSSETGKNGSRTKAPESIETLQATLWVQHAIEYKAITSETYQSATENLETYLADSTFTAAVEQQGEYTSKPPAVILDVDETVLDNSPYQARMIRRQESYSSASWADWVNEAKADPVPGALDFTQAADRKGITVFYLTNRDHSLEPATRKNLKELGFPLQKIDSQQIGDVILTNGEKPNWNSSKIERRAAIASHYRVLMLIGDDFNDLMPAKGKSLEERVQLFEEHESKLGSFWFILPNPVYGSWESSMMDEYPEMEAGELDVKRKLLNPKQ